MEIAILDGFTLNPGDLSWEQINALGKVNMYERTSKAELLARCSGCEIILTNKVKLDRNIINSLPDLRYIGVLATGYNIVDVIAAREKGITVCNVPAYSSNSVAQLTIGMMIELMEDLSGHINSVGKGTWEAQEDFSYTTRTTRELAGKTLGIIGYGQIAKKVIQLARAFGMEIIVFTSHPDNNPEIDFVGREELFSKSDIISIHTSLRPDNEKIVNRDTLGLMKTGAYVINTSRGGLIDEFDLAEFLNNERVAGAALDVLSEEPPGTNNPLLHAKNCKITPHIAWATSEARQRLMDVATANIKAFLEGRPVNVVN